MGVREGIDPSDLEAAGWGLVLPADGGAELREALRPLIDLRRAQAGGRYRELEWRPGESKISFLARYKMGPGPPTPSGSPTISCWLAHRRRRPFGFNPSSTSSMRSDVSPSTPWTGTGTMCSGWRAPGMRARQSSGST